MMAEKTGLSLKDSNNAVDAFVDAFGTAMKKGDRIQMPGMGTFKVEKRSARTARNPRTGQEIKVPAKKVVKFKAAPSLTDNIQ